MSVTCRHCQGLSTKLPKNKRLPEEGSFSRGGSELQGGHRGPAAVHVDVQRAPAGMCRVAAGMCRVRAAVVGRCLQTRQAWRRPRGATIVTQL